MEKISTSRATVHFAAQDRVTAEAIGRPAAPGVRGKIFEKMRAGSNLIAAGCVLCAMHFNMIVDHRRT